jgi:excinuclease ABC subunit C
VSAKPDNTEFDQKTFLATLTSKPGVYRMFDADGTVLYVGKARNLKKRVSSYFRKTGLSAKSHHLMQTMHKIEVTITHNEKEAFILENNLIKEFKPRYNILLRDDKSYPYIYLSSHQEFPRLGFYRGKTSGPGKFFGPYPSTTAVRDSLRLLQKLFPVRQCEDSFFRNRSRPCLQYQIKRCTAPCVGLISHQQYAEDVHHAEMFLSGKSQAVIDALVKRMDRSAEKRDYERAAIYRDQIASLRKLQEKQYVSKQSGNLDVIACAIDKGACCVQIFMIRDGRNLGSKSLFPSHVKHASNSDAILATLSQHYLNSFIPDEILISDAVEDKTLFEEVLGDRAGHRVKITDNTRGERSRWIKMALNNAEMSLKQRLASKASMQSRYEHLQDALSLDSLPTRMECFDISHTMGEATVASCVVFDLSGPVKSDYRRFNIESITPGDDYAAIHQALLRRYRRLAEGEGKFPDILIIDGGKGQLAEAEKVMNELNLSGMVVMSVAKGPERKAGMETLFLLGAAQPIILPADSPALHLIQQIRDEAHRFAITGHRQRRGKKRNQSPLEDIEGMGPKRRQSILKHFGGLQGVQNAGVEDLAGVTGISEALAKKVYDAFHHDSD